MTTSGTVSFSVSRDDLITLAMQDAGALGVGESISNSDLTFCAQKLNMLVKQWQGTADFAPGLKMWSRKRGNLFLSQTTGQYSLGPSGAGWATSFTSTTLSVAANAGASTITVTSASSIGNGDNIGILLTSGVLQWTTVNGAPAGNVVTLTAVLSGAAASGNTVFDYTTSNQARRPLQLVTAVLRDSQSNDTPILTMNVQDYEALPSKVNVQAISLPTAVYYESQLTNGVLYTDCPGCSDNTQYLHIVYLSPIEDFNIATDTPDYPQQWYRALASQLAMDICPGFQLPVTQELKLLRDESLMMARQQDAENTSFFFQPGMDDYRPWGNQT